MTDKRHTYSFKSYVGLDDDYLNTSNDDSLSENLTAQLLPGEMLIAEAQHVLMFAQVCERNQGKSGLLCVTNFKLSFITADDKSKEESAPFQDVLQLGENDVCLSNIDALYMFGDRKRKLIPGRNITDRVKGLHVLCKNMRLLSFSFKFSPVGHGKTLTNTLLHHAFPRRHTLLFGYDYREPQYPCPKETLMFRDAGDWGKELARLGAQGWRLTAANHDFQMFPNLPRWLVVPSRVLDWQLGEAGRHFNSNRPPLWSWSSPEGAALVRMADIIPTITDRVQENIMLECVRKSHPRLSPPAVIDLSRDLPSVKDLMNSYIKFRELNTPEDLKQFWMQDQHFLSLLDQSKWLHYVSACLSKALQAAKILYRNSSVALQEGDGRDGCCIVSCLSQLLLDPHSRSLHGFQSLVQREWVVSGHPFCSRLAHVYQPDSTQQSPMFLLFLDCVWQLTQQFPTKFQFTETYLTVLWESALISIFDTFLFDCEKDRMTASMESNDPLLLRSVWEELPNSREAVLFLNPLYTVNNSSSSARGRPSIDLLQVKSSLPNLELWLQNYCRHIPLLEISRGGPPQIDMFVRTLLGQVECGGTPGEGGSGSAGAAPPEVNSFFPFSNSATSGPGTGSSPPAALLLSCLSLNTSFHSSSEMMLDSQSILNGPD